MPVITDANVLIDYADADIMMLALYSEKIERVVIPSVILGEVEQLSHDDCLQYGFDVVEEDLEVLFEASNAQHGPLSFQDKVCLYLAKSIGDITCITNEKALLKFCEEDNIPTKRGLKLLLELAEQGFISKDEAIGTVYAIHECNPLHIHQGVVEDFIRLIECA
ncbi:MAG: hypothetical protein CL600_15205 [Alteromonas sp.]|uniref:hypothetical protein n=1 Tax=unclassified Alteromonas TaxID=2614992 RepID=UPI000903E71A|nr:MULTISPECIES: hypothetical protein [unclassified Alteromonas]APE06894.1 hypothetical protein BM528_14815 [Alteromonas sp. RW2A1]AUC89453.1 hypothetical protein CW735_15700 [Alteromonas sp. MB-3u-76]MAI66185.1 hypothetical protein [Alteromonas sp.]